MTTPLPDPSSAVLRQVLASSPDCVKVLDGDGRLLWMSDGGRTLFEIEDLRPMVGAAWQEWWTGAARESAVGAVAEAKAGRVGRFVGFQATAKGTPKWWDVVVSPVPGGDGGQLLVVSRDVTPQVEAERQLRASERQFRAAFDQAAVGIVVVAPDGRFRRANAAYCRMIGYTEAELEGMAFAAVTHADDVALTDENLGRVISGELPRVTYEKRYVRRDGAVVWVRATVSPDRDDDGRLIGLVGLAEDVTARKQAEADLAEANSRLGAALSAAEIGTWVFDIPADRVHADANLDALFGVGRSPDPVAGRPLAVYTAAVHPDDRAKLAAAIGTSTRDRPDFESDYRIVHPDGTTKYVLARGRVERDPAGAPLQLNGVVLDITTRVKALRDRADMADRLDAQARLFDGLLSSIDDPAYVFDPAGRFTYANRALLAIWQMPAERALGKTMAELPYPPELAARLQADVDRVVATGRPVAGEVAYFGPTGVGGVFEHRLGPILGPDGAVAAVAGMSRDVTGRRAAADALAASVDRMRFLSDLGEALRAEADPDRLVAAVTDRLGRHLGASRCTYAEVDLDGDGLAVRRDYADGCPSMVGRYRLSALGAAEAEQRRNRKTLVLNDIPAELPPAERAAFDALQVRAMICCPLARGERLRALISVQQATPRRWTADEVALVEVVSERCWTELERLRAERDRREAEGRLALAVDAADLGTFLWRLPAGPGTTYQWNATLKRFFFLPPDAEVGPDVRARMIHPDDGDRVREALRRATEDGARYDEEYRVRGPGGQERWVRAIGQSYADAHGVPRQFGGIAMDVTDAKRAEAARERAEAARERTLADERAARAEAERAGRMKDEFLATLSHELRTPLNAVIGWAQILRGDAAAGTVDPDDLAEGMRTIERNARAQAQIIDDLLDMSRVVAGKLRRDGPPIDPAAVVRAGVDTVRPAAEAKGVRFQVVLDPAAGPVSGDPNRLQQVVWNLLSNAVKFTPKGGRVQVTLAKVDSQIEVAVADTGEGIRPEFLPYVFDRFRQADASTTRKHGGLGLGLAIVKQMVELHGGSVRVASGGPGAGATFTVALPLTIVHPSSADEPPPPAAALVVADVTAAKTDLTGLHVLVVDDEPDGRRLVRRLLVACGATVDVAESVDAALARLDARVPDVLVSDIGMPDRDGFALIRDVRGRPADRGGNVPAVALTAYARGEDRLKILRAGFQMHVAKPVEPAELVAVVAVLADRTVGGDQ